MTFLQLSPMIMRMDMGRRIRLARQRLQLTQQQLAERVGVDRRTVDNWENGRSRPKNRIGALEEFLGINLSDEEPTDTTPPEEPRPDFDDPADDELWDVLTRYGADHTMKLAMVRYYQAERALRERGEQPPENRRGA